MNLSQYAARRYRGRPASGRRGDRRGVHHTSGLPQLFRTARLHRVLGRRPAHALGVHAERVGGARAGGREARAARASCARHQTAHGWRLWQQADPVEAHRDRRAALETRRATGAAHARPGGGKPRGGTSKRHAPARAPRCQARWHADRDLRRYYHGRGGLLGRRRREFGQWHVSAPLRLSQCAHRASRRAHPPGAECGVSRSRAMSKAPLPSNRRWTNSPAPWRWIPWPCAYTTMPRSDQKKEQPYSTPDSLRRCYERMAETFGWQQLQTPPDRRVRATWHWTRGPRLGWGGLSAGLCVGQTEPRRHCRCGHCHPGYWHRDADRLGPDCGRDSGTCLGAGESCIWVIRQMARMPR